MQCRCSGVWRWCVVVVCVGKCEDGNKKKLLLEGGETAVSEDGVCVCLCFVKEGVW